MLRDNKNSLSKEERLFLNRDIDELFAKGKAFIAFPLRVLYLIVEEEREATASFFVSIPKKRIKKAHDRNRLKRLVRECYRLQKHALIASLRSKQKNLFVGFIYVGNEVSSYASINQAVTKALEKIKEKTL